MVHQIVIIVNLAVYLWILAPFQGGSWKIHVEIPDHYPFKSPSIGFVNRIFHPNIDEMYWFIYLSILNFIGVDLFA